MTVVFTLLFSLLVVKLVVIFVCRVVYCAQIKRSCILSRLYSERVKPFLRFSFFLQLLGRRRFPFVPYTFSDRGARLPLPALFAVIIFKLHVPLKGSKLLLLFGEYAPAASRDRVSADVKNIARPRALRGAVSQSRRARRVLCRVLVPVAFGYVYARRTVIFLVQVRAGANAGIAGFCKYRSGGYRLSGLECVVALQMLIMQNVPRAVLKFYPVPARI